MFTLWKRRSARERLGRRGERLAARFLRKRGLRVLLRNVRCGRGEIDIIALDGETLVFVEVKSRTPASRSENLEKIDRRKTVALARACRHYLRHTREPAESYRVDGVSVEFDDSRRRPRLLEIHWVRGILQLHEGL